MEYIWPVYLWLRTNLSTVADIVSLAAAFTSLITLAGILRIRRRMVGRIRLPEFQHQFVAHRDTIFESARARSHAERLNAYSHMARCKSDLDSLSAYLSWRERWTYVWPVRKAIKSANGVPSEQRTDPASSKHIWKVHSEVAGLAQFLENTVRDNELGRHG